MMTIGYECGHKVHLVGVHERPPADEAWTTYPMIIEHPVEIGDQMTCVVCEDTSRISKIYGASMAAHEPNWVNVGLGGGGKVKYLCTVCGATTELKPPAEPSTSKH